MKSLTSVSLTHRRLVTAGLDGMIKVYKSDKSKVLELAHQIKHKEGILRMNCDPFCMNYTTIDVMGEIKIMQKPYFKNQETMKRVYKGEGLEGLEQDQEDAVLLTSNGISYSEKILSRKFAEGFRQTDRGSYKYYQRGLYAKPENQTNSGSLDPVTIIKEEKRVNLAKYDKLLRKFQVKEALETALASGNSRVIIGVIEQLLVQDDLETALAGLGQDTKGLILLSKFLCKKTNSDNSAGVISYVLERMIELFGARMATKKETREWLVEIQAKLGEVTLREKRVMIIRDLLACE